jgi:hypothetical protein
MSREEKERIRQPRSSRLAVSCSNSPRSHYFLPFKFMKQSLSLFEALEEYVHPFSKVIVQGTLDEMIESKNEAMSRVEENADEKWKHRVMEEIKHLCCRQSTFSLNDLKQEMIIFPEKTSNNAAYGPMLKRACINKWCEVTDTFVQSSDKKAHSRMIRIYKSLL